MKKIAIASLLSSVFVMIFLVGTSLVQAANSHSLSLSRGAAQYASLTNASSTGLNLNGDITIESWVKPSSQPSGNDVYTIVSKWDSDNNGRSYYFSYGAIGGNTKMFCGVSNSGTTNPVVTFSQTLNTNVWYHVAMVYVSSTGNCNIFVNGSSIGSNATDSGGAYISAASFAIGAQMDNLPSQFFDGKVDDVRVYNRALTSSEIQDAFQNPIELVGNESGLAAYWKLNNGFADSTSNNNLLTNGNSASFSSDTPFVGVLAPTISSFSANPPTISSGNSSILSWDVNDATLLSINNGIGAVTGTSTSVSPAVTTTYTLTASNQGNSTTTAQVTVTVNPSPSAVRKSTNESVSSSTVLQEDDQLSLQVQAGKTYIVDGLIIASSTSGTPDFKMAFISPASSDMMLGYLSSEGKGTDGGFLRSSGNIANINLTANKTTQIVVHGTILVGSSGALKLQWAQDSSNAGAVIVGKGSYLRFTEI